jgi:hypothetical protein
VAAGRPCRGVVKVHVRGRPGKARQGPLLHQLPARVAPKIQGWVRAWQGGWAHAPPRPAQAHSRRAGWEVPWWNFAGRGAGGTAGTRVHQLSTMPARTCLCAARFARFPPLPSPPLPSPPSPPPPRRPPPLPHPTRTTRPPPAHFAHPHCLSRRTRWVAPAWDLGLRPAWPKPEPDSLRSMRASGVWWPTGRGKRADNHRGPASCIILAVAENSLITILAVATTPSSRGRPATARARILQEVPQITRFHISLY